ncbi:MAG: hypothetical protein IJ325_09470 [Clostridia bacterium]|nr:hypothetical protein [Clostridia bacterium]
MKKTINLLAALLAGILLLSGCNNTVPDETDTTETIPETEVSTEVLEANPAKHEISVAEVESLLIANGLQTNINQATAYPIYHGGQQMRVVHTERGTYAAFGKGFAEESFYVAKIAPDNTVTLLHCGEFDRDGSAPIDIGQDINGDIVVSSSTGSKLFIYIFDKETDAVTEYAAPAVFTSPEYAYPGYAQTLFDFENRKVYVFANGGMFLDGYTLEWFTFDMETKQWSETSLCHVMQGLRRHCYIFPFTDGNGGAYIVGTRSTSIESVSDQLQNTSGKDKYVWDEILLFHIPDLTSTENITYTPVQEAYTERGHEGIWSYIVNNQHGGVFMDADGYLHITYYYNIYNLSATPLEFDANLHWRHAIYDGMECIYNEKIELQKGNNYTYNKPQIRQSTDGTLYMIVCVQGQNPMQIEIYKAEDALGKTWKLETIKTFDDVGSVPSFSISEVRNGSTQDNILSCFYYYYNGVNTGCTFNLSLEDYSTTEIVNILDGYDLRIDERVDNRSHNTAHQTKVVHTENGTYAAFVYNYASGDAAEYFHIVKIDTDNNVTILYSDSYTSAQDKYLSMQELNGEIYVCPPTGNTIYHINRETDEVTCIETSVNTRSFGTVKQTYYSSAAADGEAYMLCFNNDEFYPWVGYAYNGDDMALQSIKNTFDPILKKTVDNSIKYSVDTESYALENYQYPYVLDDGNGGVYIVATRTVTEEKLAGKLEYVGYTKSMDDSITLFHIPNLADTTVDYTDIQPPYEAEGSEGIWSVVNMADNGDAYLDSEGKLHIFYTYYHFDFDDADRPKNPELVAGTLKHYHAIYDGTTLVSNEELGIDGLTKDTSIRMAETTDGTPYLLVCNLKEEGAKIDVYSETENGWVLSQTKDLGEFTAESFSVSGPRGGSVQDNVIDCIVYANDNDVYYTTVTFE